MVEKEAHEQVVDALAPALGDLAVAAAAHLAKAVEEFLILDDEAVAEARLGLDVGAMALQRVAELMQRVAYRLVGTSQAVREALRGAEFRRIQQCQELMRTCRIHRSSPPQFAHSGNHEVFVNLLHRFNSEKFFWTNDRYRAASGLCTVHEGTCCPC